MRALIAFLLLAAAAVTLALLFRLNTGYVLFVAPPYRVELSQNAFIIIVVLGVPRAVCADPRRRARSRSCRAKCARGGAGGSSSAFRGKQDAAVVALLEGRHGKARQFARGGARDSAVVAGRSARRRARGARDARLRGGVARCSIGPTRMRRISPCRG